MVNLTKYNFVFSKTGPYNFRADNKYQFGFVRNFVFACRIFSNRAAGKTEKSTSICQIKNSLVRKNINSQKKGDKIVAFEKSEINIHKIFALIDYDVPHTLTR